MQQQILDHVRVFKAFSDEKRLAILELLQTGEKCACVLTDHTGIGQSSLSYHMKILCDSGIVATRQSGKWTFYRLSESGGRYASELVLSLTTPLPQIAECS